MRDNSSIISYIAISASILALISVLSRFVEIRITDAQFIISVFSILITLLIGWDIYKARSIKDIEKKLNVQILMQEKVKKTIENHLSVVISNETEFTIKLLSEISECKTDSEKISVYLELYKISSERGCTAVPTKIYTDLCNTVQLVIMKGVNNAFSVRQEVVNLTSIDIVLFFINT